MVAFYPPMLKNHTGMTPGYKHNVGSLTFVIVALVFILVVFVFAGIVITNSVKAYFYSQKVEEATLLGKGYANSLGTALDAEYHLNQRLHSTLKVAGVTISKYDKPFTTEQLQEFACNLDVDVIYIYDQNTILTHSSDGQYIGWEAPPDHAIRLFHQSSEQSLVEEIRADTVSGTLYKYGYYRFSDNRIVQVGILAQNISNLYKQFSPQYIVEELRKGSEYTSIVLLNPYGKVMASSNPQYIGTFITPEVLGLPVLSGQYKRIQWAGKPYLALRIPVVVKDRFEGSLLLFYEMTEPDKLLGNIAFLISTTLLLFFLLFAYSVLSIYRKNQRILTIAYHDELTNLPNQRYLQAMMEQKWEPPLACLVINPSNFKLLNMVYGYSHGDTILKKIGFLLASMEQQNHMLKAFRLSDDRFLLLANGYKTHENLEAICKEVKSIREAAGIPVSFDLRLGVVETKEVVTDYTILLKQASIALNATSSANPLQFYNTALEEKLLYQDAIASDLQDAIQGKARILSLVYQPIVEMKTATIMGFEALARMNSPKYGPVSPIEFIPIAEQRQLINGLGKEIFRQAFLFKQTMEELGYADIKLSINVSALQLLDEEFVPTLDSLLQTFHLNAKSLDLELTESVFAQDLGFIAKQFADIKALGLSISLDDFGSGYSSLNRFGSLPFDTLKLDKVFIDKVTQDSTHDLVADIISMAHHVHKVVVAEGVEDRNQQELLNNMGCDYLQGYLFSKPLMQEDALALLKERKVHV